MTGKKKEEEEKGRIGREETKGEWGIQSVQVVDCCGINQPRTYSGLTRYRWSLALDRMT